MIVVHREKAHNTAIRNWPAQLALKVHGMYTLPGAAPSCTCRCHTTRLTWAGRATTLSFVYREDTSSKRVVEYAPFHGNDWHEGAQRRGVPATELDGKVQDLVLVQVTMGGQITCSLLASLAQV